MDSCSRYLSEISEFKGLTLSEDIELSRQARGGCSEAREKLITSNLRLVVKIAGEFIGKGVSFEDLISAGNVGLVRAVEKYDPDKARKSGTKFSSYSSFWIKQSIRRSLITCATGSVLGRPLKYFADIKLIREMEEKYRALHGHAPNIDKLSVMTGITKWKITRILEAGTKEISFDSHFGGDDHDSGRPLEEKLASGEEYGARDSDMNDVACMIDEYLGNLDNSGREIIRHRFGFYGEVRTLEETAVRISKICGKTITRERVRQLQDENLEKLAGLIGNSYAGYSPEFNKHRDKRKKNKFRKYKDPLSYLQEHREYRGLDINGLFNRDPELFFALRRNNQLLKAIRLQKQYGQEDCMQIKGISGEGEYSQVKGPTVTEGYAPVEVSHRELFPGAGTFTVSNGGRAGQIAVMRQGRGKWGRSAFPQGKTIIRIGSHKEKSDICIDDDKNVEAIHASVVRLGSKVFIIERGKLGITSVNGRRTPYAELNDDEPSFLHVGHTGFILLPRAAQSTNANRGDARLFTFKTAKGEYHADFSRRNLIGSHENCNLKFDGPDFIAMTLPHHGKLFLLPFMEMVCNGSPIPPMQMFHLSSECVLNSLEAYVTVPSEAGDGVVGALQAERYSALKLIEISESEDVINDEIVLPPEGSGLLISRKAAKRHLCIESEFVSRKHASLFVYENCIQVEDLGSSNGTYVNGEKIRKKILWPGDFLSVGDRTFLFGLSVEPEQV